MRANNWVPSAVSSCRTSVVTEDCVWNRRRAACVKLLSWATATKAVRCLSVTCLGRRFIANYDRWIK
ncbi:Uncharacterised protein [Bordetella pertussis]|nr:Uncharacterised protein [Bordetella pertussis]